jgi:hypothetical protein
VRDLDLVGQPTPSVSPQKKMDAPTVDVSLGEEPGSRKPFRYSAQRTWPQGRTGRVSPQSPQGLPGGPAEAALLGKASTV